MPRSRHRVPRLVAVLVLALLAAGCSSHDETVGRVTDVASKKVFVGSTEARVGDAFPAKTRLATDGSGSVTFELDGGTGCRTRPNSELQIAPDSQITINFQNGTAICWKDPNAKEQKYLAGNTLVIAKDPVFGVTVEGDESVIKVTHGFVELETTASPAPVVVGPDQQAVISPQQSTPLLKKIELNRADERIAAEFEERLPDVKAEPPGNLAEVAEDGVLVLGMDPSVPDSVKTFARRLLSTIWDIGARVVLLPAQDLETSLRQGTVDILVAPKSAAPTDAAVPLFTRGGTAWVLAISPDNTFEQALRKLVTSSLQTGEFGELYADTFASQPTYARAQGSDTAVISAEDEDAAATTAITRKPPGTTASTVAEFEFESSKPQVLFSCQLDRSEPEPCESPQTYATIGLGEHTFTLRTTDAAGIVGQPATYTWRVRRSGGGDTTGPTTTITSGVEGETTSTSATFAFHASEEAVEYGCSLDGMAFKPCESRQSFRNLVVGDHVFAVRAVDADKNVGPARQRTWTIINDSADVGPTTRIVAKPEGPTKRTTATFRFSSEPGTQFSCALDGMSFQKCASPWIYRNVPHGRHTFAVRARARNGTWGPQARHSWSVDRQPPVTTIVNAPPTSTSERDATFSFRANEGNVQFGCSLDGSDFKLCSSPWPYMDLAVDAEHTFAVRGTDAAGNIGEPTRHEWEIVSD
jgi:hypothetical protein